MVFPDFINQSDTEQVEALWLFEPFPGKCKTTSHPPSNKSHQAGRISMPMHVQMAPPKVVGI
jgi:hypothetical protein